MSKCLQCNKEISQIEGKKTRLFCSDACRMAYKRKANKLEFKSEQTKSEQPFKSEQIKSEQKVEIGKCHACGKIVPDYICICYDCFKKGNTHESLGLEMCK